MNVESQVIRSERCAAAFDRMAWSCLFWVDLWVGGAIQVDLLPDVVGWWLLASAWTSILDLSPAVTKLRSYAQWLTFLSLGFLVQIQHAVPLEIWAFHILVLAWNFLSWLLALVLVWQTAGLIMAMGTAVGEKALTASARRYRVIYVALNFLPVIGFFLIALPQPLWFWGAFAVFALVLIAALWMILLLKRTATVCRRSMSHG